MIIHRPALKRIEKHLHLSGARSDVIRSLYLNAANDSIISMAIQYSILRSRRAAPFMSLLKSFSLEIAAQTRK